MKYHTVGLATDRFLLHLEATCADNTYLFYRKFLREFRPFAAERRLTEVTPPLVREWIGRRYRHAKPSTQYGAARAVCRLLNWAVETGKIDKSPLQHFRKPTPSHRETVLSPADYTALVQAAPRTLKDVISFLWHSGARPQEMRVVEAAWIGDGKITLPQLASKGKRKRRVIYLDAMAAAITARLAQKHPGGPIFRNSYGRPWKPSAIAQAFLQLRRDTGVMGACAYAIRHTWITRMLEKGVSVAVVAALAGNSPAIMLRVYSHVAENEEHLRRHLG